MHEEKKKVLDILAQGNITAEEAARLLDCLDEETISAPRAEAVHQQGNNANLRGKKLRVKVDGVAEGNKVDVNVSVPLVLARYADHIIASCVPADVNKDLASKGIDLRQLNIGQIVDTIESLDEDIVNVDVEQDDTDIKVRVYVE